MWKTLSVYAHSNASFSYHQSLIQAPEDDTPTRSMGVSCCIPVPNVPVKPFPHFRQQDLLNNL